MVAELLEHFHMTIADFARLTQRQQLDLYYHPREKDGSISADKAEAQAAAVVEPVKPKEDEEPTLESELRNLTVLSGIIHIPPAELTRLRGEIEAKFARQAVKKQTEEASNGPAGQAPA